MKSSLLRLAAGPLVITAVVMTGGVSHAADPPAPTQAVAAQKASTRLLASQLRGANTGKTYPGTAFAIDKSGTYLTARASVDRHGRLAIQLPDGRKVPAQRVFSTAPTGVSMLKAEASPATTPLRVSGDPLKKGDNLWAAGIQPATRCQGRLSGTRAIRVDQVDGDVAYFDLPGFCFRDATLGTPLVDAQGNLRAVAIPGGRRATAQTVEGLPVEKPAFAIDPPSDSAIVPWIVGGIGILLLLASFLLARQRRTSVRAQIGPVPAPSVAATPTVQEDDLPDLEISLKPKPTAVKPEPVEGIEIRRQS